MLRGGGVRSADYSTGNMTSNAGYLTSNIDTRTTIRNDEVGT